MSKSQQEGISDRHLIQLRESGISDEVIKQRGYRTVDDVSDLLELGFSKAQTRVPGLLIPVYGPDGIVTSHQFRPDSPRSRNGKPIKYESLPGQATRIDVPPDVRAVLGDPSVPLGFTEGVKKADCAVSRGHRFVALAGVWNFRGTNERGGSTVIGDFEQIALKGRDIYIAFDSDAIYKDSVRLAEDRLAGFLKSKGARVHVLRIPSGASGGKLGLDDYLVSGGSFEDLLAAAGDPPSEHVYAQIAELGPVDREIRLKALAREIGVPVAALREEVKRVSPANSDRLAGRPVKVTEHHPWHESVDGAVVLAELKTSLERFCGLPPLAAETIALWIVHTYIFDLFDWSPKLCVTSPMRRCGKTYLLVLVEWTSNRAKSSTGMTAAALFRLIETVPADCNHRRGRHNLQTERGHAGAVKRI